MIIPSLKTKKRLTRVIDRVFALEFFIVYKQA